MGFGFLITTDFDGSRLFVDDDSGLRCVTLGGEIGSTSGICLFLLHLDEAVSFRVISRMGFEFYVWLCID